MITESHVLAQMPNRSLYKADRQYNFVATYIAPNGDTLTTETVSLKASSEAWAAQASQYAYKLIYNFTPEDSAFFAQQPNPKTKKAKKPVAYDWNRSITTGAVEDSTELWMHPFRENQYVYTEVAPFPEVRWNKLYPDSTWGTTLYILNGWGAFKGVLSARYTIAGQEDRQLNKLELKDCWRIESVGKHRKFKNPLISLIVGNGKTKGTSYHNFYYHPDYGFTEMYYTFYDGTKISFVLDSVEESYIGSAR